MFRHNTGVDLNDFPALGAPPPNARGNQPVSSSMLSSNGLASYASTAGANLQDPLLGSGTNRSDLHLSHNHFFQQPNGFGLDPSVIRRANNEYATQQHYPGDYSATARDPWLMQQRGIQGSAESLRTQPPPGARKPDGSTGRVLQPQPTVANTSSLARTPIANPSPQSVDGAAAPANGKTADPYGLLGLLGIIRMTDRDRSMLALGSDLTTLGLDLNTSDSIYSTFHSPWLESQEIPNAVPAYVLPPCYRNVQATPEAHERMSKFSDDILFFAFYSMPNDKAQEAAAEELYERNWRYDKNSHLWLTKEVSEGQSEDRGVYIFFDPTQWKKIKRELKPSWDQMDHPRPVQTGVSFR